MQENNTTEVTEQVETTSQEEVKLTVEQEAQELKKISTMRHKILSQLVRAHLADLLSDLGFKSGMSGNQKMAMINQVLDGVEGVLDLGVNVTKTQVPEKGSTGKRVATMAGVLAQALDNRMLILAQNMEETENNKLEQVKEAQGEENVGRTEENV